MRTLLALTLLAVAGCGDAADLPPATVPAAESAPDRDPFYLQPLPVQQAQAYPETVTGRFVSLADFEDDAGTADPAGEAERGFSQARHFTINPLGEGALGFVVNVTRTGAGALQAELPPGGSLIFRMPYVRDFSPYTLLSLAVHLPAVRDDLVVTLSSPSATWSSGPQLTPAGWSTVLIDLARLARRDSFDLRRVQTVELKFAAAAEPVRFGLDDIMLVENRRDLPGGPPGLKLRKEGLDYFLRLPGWPRAITLSQDDDGLWRLGEDQPLVQLVEPGQALDGRRERLDVMGPRRVGAVELLEFNPVRVRMANTWYFPPQAGEWIDLNVPQMRWEYTFYADGRWVSALALNSAGAGDVRGVRISLPYAAGLSCGQVAQDWTIADFVGPVGLWSMLAVPDGPEAADQRANFARPPAMTLRLGQADVFAAGDIDRDGFDESQGCYFARSAGGNCRVELLPDGRPLVRPAFCIAGPWKTQPAANCQGLPLRPVALAVDGAAALVDETLARPAIVEFAGPVDVLED